MKRRLREGAKLIVADPRKIDLVSSPHVKAQHHLALKPGTNVALITALAHVVVTEGLVADDYVAQRCDNKSFNEWCEFVSKPENSPEAFESVTGVPASEVRAAARMYAAGPNSAIYYGLGVTEHSQGSTMVIGIARRGREPLAWSKQCARGLRHGQLPSRVARLPSYLGHHHTHLV
jgi:formate dehydrogenase major subunit